MALSGETGKKTLWSGTHIYHMTWAATLEPTNNRASVVVKIMLQLLSNAGTWGTGSVQRQWTMNVDGQTSSGYIPTNTSYAAGGTYTLVTKTFNLTYAINGTKSFSMSGTQDTPGGGGNLSFSGGPYTIDPLRNRVNIRAATTSGASVVGMVYIGNSSGTPLPAAEVWVGDASGVPRKAVNSG